MTRFRLRSPLSEHLTATDMAIQAIGNYFAPKQNLEFEIYKFRHSKKHKDGDVVSFLTRFRKCVIVNIHSNHYISKFANPFPQRTTTSPVSTLHGVQNVETKGLYRRPLGAERDERDHK